jgi:hypothetical protein
MNLSCNYHANQFLARPQDQVRFTIRESTSTTKEDAEAVMTPRMKGEKNTKLTRLSNHAEYHNKTITKLFGGNSLYGCYALAVTIFTLGIVRDSMYASLFYHLDPEATTHYAPNSIDSHPKKHQIP